LQSMGKAYLIRFAAPGDARPETLLSAISRPRLDG
jgi:hypothetical protein